MWKHTNRLAYSCGRNATCICECVRVYLGCRNVVDVTVHENSCTNYNNALYTMFHFSRTANLRQHFPSRVPHTCVLQMWLCTHTNTLAHVYILSKRNERQSIKFRRKYFSSLSVAQSIHSVWSPISRFTCCNAMCQTCYAISSFNVQ